MYIWQSLLPLCRTRSVLCALGRNTGGYSSPAGCRLMAIGIVCEGFRCRTRGNTLQGSRGSCDGFCSPLSLLCPGTRGCNRFAALLWDWNKWGRFSRKQSFLPMWLKAMRAEPNNLAFSVPCAFTLIFIPAPSTPSKGFPGIRHGVFAVIAAQGDSK